MATPLDLSTLSTFRALLTSHLSTNPPPTQPSASFIPLLSDPTLSIHAFHHLQRLLSATSSSSQDTEELLKFIDWGIRRCKEFSKAVRRVGGVAFLGMVVERGGGRFVRGWGERWGGHIGEIVERRWGGDKRVIKGAGGDGDHLERRRREVVEGVVVVDGRVMGSGVDDSKEEKGVGNKGDEKRGDKELRALLGGVVEETERIKKELDEIYELIPRGSLRWMEEMDSVAEAAKDHLLALKAREREMDNVLIEAGSLMRGVVEELSRLELRELTEEAEQQLEEIRKVEEKWKGSGMVVRRRKERRDRADDMSDSDSDEGDWEETVVVTEPVASVVEEQETGVSQEHDPFLQQQTLTLRKATARTRRRGGKRQFGRVQKGNEGNARSRLRSAIRKRKRGVK